MLLISLIILLSQGRPILFKQNRLGYKGKKFNLIKFRTMNFLNDQNGDLLGDNDRITNLGRILRKFSLDELPSFFNVLVRDMSIVGPRPFISDYKNLYTKRQMRRHDVLPGITGWAQVNGRNLISWKEKFELDIWYVNNQTLWLDLKILFLTFWKVFKTEGINSKNQMTMERFTGDN